MFPVRSQGLLLYVTAQRWQPVSTYYPISLAGTASVDECHVRKTALVSSNVTMNLIMVKLPQFLSKVIEISH